MTHILNTCQIGLLTNTKKDQNVEEIPHWKICQHHGIKTSKTLWTHHPEPVTENNKAKMLRVFDIRIVSVIPAQRPGIVEIDKTMRTTTVIDVAVNLDWKVKDIEKILKYHDLRIEIITIWNLTA